MSRIPKKVAWIWIAIMAVLSVFALVCDLAREKSIVPIEDVWQKTELVVDIVLFVMSLCWLFFFYAPIVRSVNPHCIAKKRICPWLVVAGLMVAASLVFHYLSWGSSDYEGDNWRHCALIFDCDIVLVTLLLLIIGGWALVHSRSNTDVSFREFFGRIFHSNWVYGIFFIVLMVTVNVVWDYVTMQALGHHPQVYLKEYLWYDIINTGFKAPIREEPIWRFLPFFVASIPIAAVKPKGWKIALGVLLGLMLFCVQLQFGYVHYNPQLADIMHDDIRSHLFIQGGAGVIYSVTYGVALYHGSVILKKAWNPNGNWTLLLAHPLAYLASCTVHALFNLFTVLTNIYHPFVN